MQPSANGNTVGPLAPSRRGWYVRELIPADGGSLGLVRQEGEANVERVAFDQAHLVRGVGELSRCGFGAYAAFAVAPEMALGSWSISLAQQRGCETGLRANCE
jgi:hypothetical protein